MGNAVTACPICLQGTDYAKGSDYGERVSIICQCCGRFTFTNTVAGMLAVRNSNGTIDKYKRASLMHRIRKASSSSPFELNSTVLKRWLEDDQTLPSPAEQLENLILWLATDIKAAGQQVDLVLGKHQAIIGAADNEGFDWVLSEAENQGWVTGSLTKQMCGPGQMLGATLTLAGWRLADDLKRSNSRSRLAFIAMKFGDAELDALLRDHFKPAVSATGFELRALNDEQPAGLIDDQMRVAIRRARFVLVDITHGNKGAYWEAGFAEGLGKPVIYLCREDVFNSADPLLKPHFDTSHLVTISWKASEPEAAAAKLAACIRATLPDEAVMGSEE